MLYDLWLSSGTRNYPEIQDIIEEYPPLANRDFLTHVQEQFPGFLGLDLPQHIADILLNRFKSDWARGMVVPSAYRRPTLTKEIAYSIGERTINELWRSRYPQYTLAPIEFDREHAMWWTFKADVLELVAQGKVPGALFASVDKLDGHVWRPEEFEKLFTE